LIQCMWSFDFFLLRLALPYYRFLFINCRPKRIQNPRLAKLTLAIENEQQLQLAALYDHETY